jgi:membrane fusion protein (multidrug efflux system)
MKLRSIFIIISIILALILIKIFFLKDTNSTLPKAGANKAQIVNVTGYVVHPQALDNKITSSGTVMANEEVELRPEVSGKLTHIYFREGMSVQKGTLLAKINDADLQAQLRKLQLQLKLAKEREARLKGLLDIQGVSQEEYDAVVGQSQSITADIDFTKAQIAKTEIRAPYNGKIGLKQISEGSFVSSVNLIAKIQQTDVLKIDFTIPERYTSIVAVGNMIDFTVENQQGHFAAQVFAIEPKIDQQTRNITIRAVYRNAHSTIYPGSFAKIELSANKSESALMIPTEAVIPELKGKKVFVNKSGKAIPIKVQTGIRTDSMVEILTGLNDGDTVITTGIMSLKPEAAIKIISFHP